MLAFALLVALAVFFACLGLWPAQAQRLSGGWTADRLRQRFRGQVRRARLRTVA